MRPYAALRVPHFLLQIDFVVIYLRMSSVFCKNTGAHRIGSTAPGSWPPWRRGRIPRRHDRASRTRPDAAVNGAAARNRSRLRGRPSAQPINLVFLRASARGSRNREFPARDNRSRLRERHQIRRRNGHSGANVRGASPRDGGRLPLAHWFGMQGMSRA